MRKNHTHTHTYIYIHTYIYMYIVKLFHGRFVPPISCFSPMSDLALSIATSLPKLLRTPFHPHHPESSIPTATPSLQCRCLYRLKLFCTWKTGEYRRSYKLPVRNFTLSPEPGFFPLQNVFIEREKLYNLQAPNNR